MINADCSILEEDVFWGHRDATKCGIHIKDCSLGTCRCTGY
jgi:hypothetical protein